MFLKICDYLGTGFLTLFALIIIALLGFALIVIIKTFPIVLLYCIALIFVAIGIGFLFREYVQPYIEKWIK